jgi:hypothetical protein
VAVISKRRAISHFSETEPRAEVTPMENPASLKGKRYAVLSETYFEQDELVEPVRELKRARESD